jgi:OOP family OmpA-OmpF porin
LSHRINHSAINLKEFMMNTRHFKPLIAAAMVTGGLCAIAAPVNGIYAGASLGVASYPDNINGVTGDGSATSGKIFAGYQVNPNFAVEAGIAELGGISNASGQIDAQSRYLDAVGTLPMSEKWSLLGRVGVAQTNVNTSLGNDSGTGLKFGLGAQYALTNNVAIRGEWERYQTSVFGDTPNVDQYTVGVKVAF